MSPWVAIACVAAVRFALKAAGPLLLADRPLPPWAVALVDALAPALLAGLLVVALLGRSWSGADPTVLPGLAVLVLLHRLRVPHLGCVAAALVVTVAVRLVAG